MRPVGCAGASGRCEEVNFAVDGEMTEDGWTRVSAADWLCRTCTMIAAQEHWRGQPAFEVPAKAGDGFRISNGKLTGCRSEPDGSARASGGA